MKTRSPSRLRSVPGIAAAMLISCLPCVALAQSCGNVADRGAYCPGEDKERWEEDWQEAVSALPPLPSDENLRALDADRADPRYEYLLDRASIRRGKDGVMRYVVVVTSPTGSRNVFFEGIRCETDEAKTYAFAGTGSAFSRSTGSRWAPVAIRGVRAYQEYLAAVILCDRNGFAWDAENAVTALDRQYTAGGVRIKSFCRDCMDVMDERRND